MVEILVNTPGLTKGYAPRDVINAPAIKKAIVQRSQARNDPADIQAWLVNHLYRHLVGNLVAPAPQLQRVESLEQALALAAPGVTPDWVVRRIKQSTGVPLWWLDAAGPAVLALESQVLEFLHTRQGTPLQGKLMRVNCPQALALWRTEHDLFASQALSGWQTHQPSAVRTVWEGAGGVFVELLGPSAAPNTLLRAEMAYESQMMQHCLGQFSNRQALTGGYGEHYATECEAGRMRLFSFRTGQQQPHVTVSALVTPDARLQIDQIKGKQNRPPIARYQEAVLGLLNTLPTTLNARCADAANMGIVRVSRGWCRIGEVRDEHDQLGIVHHHPALVRELSQTTPAVQWLVAGLDPACLAGLTLTPSVARVLASQA
jgi:hypothetical protein